ncbi:MAG: Omp28-related outer membrane protein [Bacteroidia bacterium]|nr:Omp28-related outer membrane protein [Bacteroidia bacterium]
MKHLHTLFGLTLFFFVSCDYVKSPVQNTSGNPTPGPEVERRKILIEDYTGHRCGTCPPAAVMAQQLHDAYGEQVVILSVHAGFLSTVSSAPYTNNFTTTVGDTWFGLTGFNLVVTPSGMINRLGFPTAAHNIPWGAWTSFVDTMVTALPDAYLTIDHTYNSSTRTITGTLKTKFYENFTGLYKLVMVLMQDSIIAPQLDNNAIPPDVMTYMHRHVLRDNITPAWGDTLISTTVMAGDSIITPFNYTIQNTYGNIACDDTKCHIVAFFYDDNSASPTYRQVIQAEEVRVR